MDRHAEFTKLSRAWIYVMCWALVSPYYIAYIKGRYYIQNSHWLARMMLILGSINAFIKFIYLTAAVLEHFGPVSFLDKTSILLYILICAEMLQEFFLFGQKYPIYEILLNIWTVEENIMMKCSRAKKFVNGSDRIHYGSIVFHSLLCIGGPIVITWQFLAAPNAAIWTYCAVETNNIFIFFLFNVHECIFMFQAWTLYCATVMLSTLIATEVSFAIDGMADRIEVLRTENQPEPFAGSIDRNQTGTLGKMNCNKLNRMKKIDEIIMDYKQLSLALRLLNEWCSYRIIGIHTIGYCQFVSDVFNATQVLRLPGATFDAIAFFLEDGLTCLRMIFRMFATMARVWHSAVAFNHILDQELIRKNAYLKPYYRTVKATVRPFGLMIGPSYVSYSTCMVASSILLDYYLVVALWK